MGRQKRHESVQKKIRQRAKEARRRAKRERRTGKSSGVEEQHPSTFTAIERMQRQQKADPRKKVLQLRQIGGGRFPKITVEVFNKLKKRESTFLGQYSFTVIRDWIEENRVRFDVGYNLDLSSRNRKHLGLFEIDFEKNTITRLRRT